ncbi:MAG: hypothetical protein MZV70_19065 [Desulfobacterales bacterium]|nr:hypothetical protein [Desulfobacterales bacterium]
MAGDRAAGAGRRPVPLRPEAHGPGGAPAPDRAEQPGRSGQRPAAGRGGPMRW